MYKNLHLMPINSGFNAKLIDEINQWSPLESNIFVWKDDSPYARYQKNCIADSKMFSAQFLNAHHSEYHHIFFHSLYMEDSEILKLSNEAANKITWVVWGHDLYKVKTPIKSTFRSVAYHFYKYLQQYNPIIMRRRAKVAAKIGQFERIAIGYSYDEREIRNKYGDNVPVVYGPYFSKESDLQEAISLRNNYQNRTNGETTNVLIGHCGADFIQHEKYLKRLSKYKNESIHVYMVLSYLASSGRIYSLAKLAEGYFGKENFTILDKKLPRNEYFAIMNNIDIAIFPYLHQSGLGNTRRMAYMGIKLYFEPKGVLYRGFMADGVKVYDCNEIGKVPFCQFIKNDATVNINSKLFDTFDYQRNIQAWKDLVN